ncbi:unnamed protein product [Closterium sp. NIES-64]|nr:unnamed protein product [Closterium sp. NIES-64]
MAGDTRLTQPRSSSNPTAGNAPNKARNAAPNPAAAKELPPPSFHVDVAIAGGGLAGLALAAGLQARGVEAVVFEAAPALRSSNSTVLVIWPNGAAALDGILPGLSASVARHGTLVNRRRLYNRRKPPPPSSPPGGAESGPGESGCAESGGSGSSGARAGGGSAVGSDGAVQSSDWLVVETEEAGLNMVPWRRIQEALASTLPRPDLVRCGHRVIGYRPLLLQPRGGGEAEAGETGGTGGAGEAGEAGRAWEAGGVRGAVGLGEGTEESGRSEVEAVDVVCEVAGLNPGEKQLVVVRAKVLVGADGVRSAVRDQMIGDSPRFLNQIAWNLFLSTPVDVSSPADVSSSGESREAAVPELTALIDEVTGCSAIFITLKNGERFWQVWAGMVLGDRYVDYEMDPTLQGTPFAGFGSKHNIKARLLPLIQTNLPHHPLWERAFQEASSTPENLIFERRQLDRPPPADSWSDPVCGNRVVLIGDAAHAMDPGPGQGAMTGFEDAHQLSLCLGEAWDPDLLTKPAAVAAAVREFEARRIARCVKVHRHATGLIGYGEEGREFKSRSVEHQMKASMELTSHYDNQAGMAADNRLTQPRGSSSNPQAARNASHTAQNAAPNPTAAAELPRPSFHVDVAISGGGLAGLALAAGLQARGIEAAVFEAAPAAVRSNNSTGTILGMFPNGYKALEGLKPGLGNAVIASGSPLTKTKLSFRDFPADITGSDSVNASTSGPATNDAAMKGTSENCDGWVVMEAEPQDQTIVGWARAQEVLASSLTQPESIMHGHRVVAYYPVVAGIPVGSGLLGGGGGSESGDGVGDGEVEAVDVVLEVACSNPEADAHNSSFADLEGAESAYEAGAVEQQRQLVVIRAKILVAADGVRSVVRNQMIGDSPRYLEQIAWNALVPKQLSGEVYQQGNQSVNFVRDNTTGYQLFLINDGHGETFWQVSAADPDGHLKARLEQTPFGGFGKPGVKGRLMCHISKNMADPSGHATWHTMLKVVTSTHSCNIYERWMMDRPPPKDTWSDSKCGNRVVLMGDAAHAMHPGPGQGAQIAFEDAHQLCLCLADIKDVLAEPAAVAAAVREYEARRIESLLTWRYVRCRMSSVPSADQYAPTKKAHRRESLGWGGGKIDRGRGGDRSSGIGG